MSTRCYVIYAEKDGTYTYSYIHNDGYVRPNGVGARILEECYSTNPNYAEEYNDRNARELVAIGDRSIFDDDKPYDDQKEVVHKAKKLDKILKEGWDIGYFYLFKDGEWSVACSATDYVFVRLTAFYVATLASMYKINLDDIKGWKI